MEWKELSYEDRETIDIYTKDRFSTCDYNFTNQLLWSRGENTCFKIEEDILIIKGEYQGNEYYYMPVPKNKEPEMISNWKKVISEILSQDKKIMLVPEEWKELLEGEFELVETRDSFDYIYNSVDLGTLTGRKYTKKKNKANSFKKKYEYTYEVITRDNIEDVIKFQQNWYEDSSKSEVLENENQGIMSILKNYFDLGLLGAMIKIDKEVIAYTIGEQLKSDMAVIHIEKALNKYNGSYQMINKLFAQKELSSYTYINREDDFGNEGLREAKTSYHPVMLLKKYEIIKKL